jgi:hypothetical protein
VRDSNVNIADDNDVDDGWNKNNDLRTLEKIFR